MQVALTISTLPLFLVGNRSDASPADNGKDILMPMVSVSLPIFRKKYKAGQSEAQLMQESFSLQREEVSNRLISSYDMVCFEIQKQQELIELYEEQIVESKQALNLLLSAYANSGKDFEEVLRMQQQILKYQKRKVTSVSKYYKAWAKHNYITAKTR